MIKESTSQHEELARLFGALSSDKRIQLLLEASEKEHCQNEIPESAGLSRFTVNIKLKHLRKAGLIKGNLQQRNTSWCINYETINHFKELFDTFYEALNKNRFNEKCCATPKK
jgi:predicted transcriptional regulator